MTSPISAKRKNDAVITVCQNNSDEKIEITSINRAAERLTGYPIDMLEHQSFNKILPDDLKDDIESYVEFDASGGRDLASVLRKMLHFNIKRKDGRAIPVSLKVFYVLSEDANPRYELLMRDITLLKHLEELKKRLVQSNEQSHDTDKDTGLPGKEGIASGVALVNEYMADSDIEASFVVLSVDKLEELASKNGIDSEQVIIAEAGKLAQNVCRSEDVIGYLGKGKIGMLLFDCNAEDARGVLNRIRMKIENTPVAITPAKPDQTSRITASMGFIEIKPGNTLSQLIESCATALEKAHKEGGNRIVNAG